MPGDEAKFLLTALLDVVSRWKLVDYVDNAEDREVIYAAKEWGRQ